LGGAEMSRSESYSEGRVPLHTIRADIDYGFVEAKTTFGRIGVKVWINKGEIMPEGYEGLSAREGRLGDQDQARRLGGVSEGLSASREGGRGRGADREGLGPVRTRRRRGGGPQREGRERGQERAEQPRTDEEGVSAEGREQPEIQPEVETAPQAVVDAPEAAEEPKTVEEPGEEPKGPAS
jgi:small subunit ribosomal protein S3